MINKIFLCVLVTFIAATTLSFAQSSNTIEGRWDITFNSNGEQKPSWLEVTHSGIRTWVGRFVGEGGSARPVAEVIVKNDSFHFAIPPQWESAPNYMQVAGIFSNESLTGNITMPSGEVYSFTAVRAPELKRKKPPVWGTPIKLFNGKDLTGWQALGQTNQWIVENGVLRSPKSGANLRTEKTFTDFKLHVEFRYPAHSNSGVYLRGRYEVQVEDSKGKEAAPNAFGGLYGFLKPYENMAKAPGEWQSFDITLIGRMVTVVANGKLIINNQEIPGITGGALDCNEAEPGPIFFQGDHGPVDYRNVVITPGK